MLCLCMGMGIHADENFRAKVAAKGDNLLAPDGCDPNPCANGGNCISDGGNKHVCKCFLPFTGNLNRWMTGAKLY